MGVGSDSNFCGRTQGAAGIIAVAPRSIYVVGTGISRGLQASLRQRPGVARAAELCQAAGGSCVALREEEIGRKNTALLAEHLQQVRHRNYNYTV